MKNLLVTLLCVIAGAANGQTLNFSSKADMPTARAGSVLGIQGDFAFVANGFAPSEPFTSQIEKYNFATDNWSTFSTSIPTIAKRYGSGVVLASKLYLYNGITATGKNDKFEIIDLNTGNVTVGATLNPNPVYNAGSAVYGDYLLSFGGCISEWEGVYSNKLYKIAPWGEWTQLADMPVALETKGTVIYGNGTNSKLYAFGGYRQISPVHENFESASTTGNLVLADWINVATAGTKVFQGKVFSGNKYAQVTAFGGDTESVNEAWLISPLIDMPAMGSYLTFDTKDGYDNGATLQAYMITNWTGDIATSDKTLLNATISTGHAAGYGADFISSGNIPLTGNSGNFRIAFKYTGGNLPVAATTTYQIDNVKVYNEYKSNSVFVYDFASNTWTTNSDVLPQTVSAHAVAVGEGDTKIIIAGDYDNQTFLGYYNTQTANFTTLTQTNMIGRRHHGAAVSANQLYLFGGNTTNLTSSSMSSTQSSSLAVLSAPEFSSGAEFSFYPNPATDKITFNSGIKNILLFTFEGKNIGVTPRNNELDLSGLSSGIYLVQGIGLDGKRFSKKLIKN